MGREGCRVFRTMGFRSPGESVVENGELGSQGTGGCVGGQDSGENLAEACYRVGFQDGPASNAAAISSRPGMTPGKAKDARNRPRRKTKASLSLPRCPGRTTNQ